MSACAIAMPNFTRVGIVERVDIKSNAATPRSSSLTTARMTLRTASSDNKGKGSVVPGTSTSIILPRICMDTPEWN